MDKLSLTATRFESNTLVKDKTGEEEEEEAAEVTEDSLDLEALVMVEVPLTDLRVDLDLEEEEEVTAEDHPVADLMEEVVVVGASIVDLEEETGSLRDLQEASEEGQAILLLEGMDHQEEEEEDQMDPLPSGHDLLPLEGKNFKWMFSSGDVFFTHVFLYLHES